MLGTKCDPRGGGGKEKDDEKRLVEFSSGCKKCESKMGGIEKLGVGGKPKMRSVEEKFGGRNWAYSENLLKGEELFDIKDC